eukprot:UN22672
MKYVFIFRFLCIFCRDYFRNRGYRLNVFSGMYHIFRLYQVRNCCYRLHYFRCFMILFFFLVSLVVSGFFFTSEFVIYFK